MWLALEQMLSQLTTSHDLPRYSPSSSSHTAFVAISPGRSMCFSERSPRRIKAEFLQQPGLAMIGELLSAEMAEEKTRGSG